MMTRLRILLFAAATVLTGQEPHNSAKELIHRLNHPRDWLPGANAATFTCGSLNRQAEAYQEVARSLVALGEAAVPDLEAGFESLQKYGMQSEFSSNVYWLFLAYAKIKGPAAYARLEPLCDNEWFTIRQKDSGLPLDLPQLQGGLDVAIATAFGLTSYVSRLRIGLRVICHFEEPRDSLDRLVVAWRNGDRKAFEAELGPNGKEALESERWHETTQEGGAIGYRLEIAGRWSQPKETLAPMVWSIDTSKDPLNPEINVRFTDRLGRDCGSHRVQFLTPKRAGFAPFLIDNSDLGELLGKLRVCTM
jgi:hypothetical protein